MAGVAQKHGVSGSLDSGWQFQGNVVGTVYSGRGKQWFVDTDAASSGAGASWSGAFATMAEALAVANTNDAIYFVGDVREELTGSNLVFDLTIIGCGNRAHSPDIPSSAYRSGASSWRPPASPTTATPLLEVRGRGWTFVNIMFDCPVDAAAILLSRNALSGTSEYDASHASFIGCHFDSGLYGIENAGGCGYVLVDGCRFFRLNESGGAGIVCSSTAVAIPLDWEIKNNEFSANESHILSSLSQSTIKNNTFGYFTGTLSVDVYNQPSAGQGANNTIWGNYLSGTYGATAYPAGSNNEWGGNFNSLSGGVTAADPT